MKKLALVTGASKGIGAALTTKLVKVGFQVIGIGRDLQSLEKLKQELGSPFSFYLCDLAQASQIRDVSLQLKNSQLCPSLFFLNAGIAGEKAVEESPCIDADFHRQIMAVNYFGVIDWVSCWQEACQQNGGATFVVTSSINAIFAPPAGSAYAASKAAVSKAFEGFSLTYCHTNLKFAVVYAGPVATEGLKGTLPFTWSAEKMADYTLSKILKNKTKLEPSWFYSAVARLLRILPYRWTYRLLSN
ncbi:MAG: SDR family NAD(P)-dependent oxidoreductase [Parachlamydiaceae bacterium]